MFISQFFITCLLGSLLAGLFVPASALFIVPGIRRRLQGWLLRLKLWTARPLKTAALSSLYGKNSYVSLNSLREIMARNNVVGPIIIDILGDVKVEHKFTTRQVLPGILVVMLGALTGPFGSYWILGNHNWWHDTLAQTCGHGLAGRCDLVVSGGIGCSLGPVQFGGDPKITLVILKAAV